MGKVFEGIDEKLREWIGEQPLFFVGTAPPQGHVNVSPKGPIGSFAVPDENTVAWLDITGSGIETAAHLAEGSSVCVMFCSFSARPRILRLHGSARTIWHGDEGFDELLGHFSWRSEELPQLRRSIIVMQVERIADACGFGVPLMEYIGQRDNAERWGRGLLKRSPEGLVDYQEEKNSRSIDGLAGIPAEVLEREREQTRRGA